MMHTHAWPETRPKNHMYCIQIDSAKLLFNHYYALLALNWPLFESSPDIIHFVVAVTRLKTIDLSARKTGYEIFKFKKVNRD